jgi:hypothetical protein
MGILFRAMDAQALARLNAQTQTAMDIQLRVEYADLLIAMIMLLTILLHGTVLLLEILLHATMFQ